MSAPIPNTVPGQYPIDFVTALVECLPANYRPPETRDFLSRLLAPNAEDLTRVHQVFDNLYTYLDPYACPEDWLDWILTEWWGWTLIPDGYPIARKRRLLANLWRYYQQRYTIPGIAGLLLEFGVHAIVTDSPCYWGGYYGLIGSSHPLNTRVQVQHYEPFFSPRSVFYGNYYGASYFYGTPLVVTDDFVTKLCHWERVAGTRMLIEWKTFGQRSQESQLVLG